MIKVKQKGNFAKLEYFLVRAKKGVNIKTLEKYGKKGVEALSASTPVNTGLTANSWYYKISEENGSVKLQFCNSNVNDNVLIAIILQYGHGTRNGGWVEGVDYINPALKPVFDKLTNEAWREVTNNEH